MTEPEIKIDFLLEDARRLPPAMEEMFRRERRAELARQEVECRERLESVGAVFLALALQRRRWDPRRFGNHYVAWRCLRLSAIGMRP